MRNPTPLLTAITISPAAHAWLSTTRRARVLHVFAQAFNLVNDRGQILAVVSEGIGPGPFSMVTEDLGEREGFLQWVEADAEVIISDEALSLGSMTLQFADAEQWQPRPKWSDLQSQPERLRRLLPLLRDELQVGGFDESLTFMLQASNLTLLTEESISFSSGILSNVHQALVEAASPLLRGLNQNDLDLGLQGAKGIAGLGSGLTPAGDDFLIGAIYSVWSSRSEDLASGTAQKLALAAAPRSNLLSAAWLHSAGRGEANQDWHDFVHAAARLDEGAARHSMARILQTGETSGADALTGFTLGLSALIEN